MSDLPGICLPGMCLMLQIAGAICNGYAPLVWAGGFVPKGRGREREASDKVNKTKRVLATMMASYLCRFAEGDGQGETDDSGFAVGV